MLAPLSMALWPADGMKLLIARSRTRWLLCALHLSVSSGSDQGPRAEHHREVGVSSLWEGKLSRAIVKSRSSGCQWVSKNGTVTSRPLGGSYGGCYCQSIPRTSGHMNSLDELLVIHFCLVYPGSLLRVWPSWHQSVSGWAVCRLQVLV